MRRAIASVEDNKRSNMFLAPDEDFNPRHGENNLVIVINDEKVELDEYTHKHSNFFKVNMLEGALDDFLDKINDHCMPLKDRVNDLESASLIFLIVGGLASAVLGGSLGYLFNYGVSFGIGALYIITLIFIFCRNKRLADELFQAFILNLAILIYLENQTVFFKRGVRCQMGHMGQWLELVNERKTETVDDI